MAVNGENSDRKGTINNFYPDIAGVAGWAGSKVFPILSEQQPGCA